MKPSSDGNSRDTGIEHIAFISLSTVFVIAACFLLLSGPTVPTSPAILQQQTVMLDCADSNASGILFKRRGRNGEPRTFVWTAAHFAKRIGTNKVTAIQDIVKGRRPAGKLETEARVVEIIPDYDLALLELENPAAFEFGATFDLSGAELPLGAPLSHVGCWQGQEGHRSYSEGVNSYPVRLKDLWPGVPMGQATTICFPGSSGGPLFSRTTGKVVGMELGMSFPVVNYFLPMDVWIEQAHRRNLLWALDPLAPMPVLPEKKLPVTLDIWSFLP